MIVWNFMKLKLIKKQLMRIYKNLMTRGNKYIYYLLIFLNEDMNGIIPLKMSKLLLKVI